METGQFTFGPPPMPSFFSSRPVADRLEGSSTSTRSRQLRSTPMERDEAESSTPQSSVVTSVVVVDNRKKTEGPGETIRSRYLERVKDLDLWIHEAHISRAKTLETADLTGISKKSIMGPVNYRHLKNWGVQAS